MSKNNVLSPDTENKVALYFQNKLWWTMQQIKFKSYYFEKYMFDPSEKSFTTQVQNGRQRLILYQSQEESLLFYKWYVNMYVINYMKEGSK